MRAFERIARALLALCWVAAPSSALAQGSSGIAGAVRDPSGAVLPGVTVEASSPALIEKVRSAVTDGEGQYRIVGLPPGIYAVTFSLPSFSTFKREGVELAASFTATVNADMRIGALEETVTVSGQSPVVDVQNTTTRKQITREALDTVPTNKTLEAFAALTPGITMGSGNAQDVGGSKGETYVQLQVHGSRVGDAKTLLDGFETNEWSGRVFVPNPAGAQEVSIDLGNGAAEAPANGVYVNFVLRDGGNTAHGTFFGSYTNSQLQSVQRLPDDLRARGLSQSDLGRVLYIWDANGSIGGPVQRDRLWFHHSMRSWGSANAVVGGYYNSIPTSWFYEPDLSRPAHDDFRNWITSERLTLQASPRNKFNINYDQEYRCDCHRTVSSTLAPEAAAVRTYHPKVLGITWDFPATSRLLFSAGTTVNSMNYRPDSQPETPLDTIGVVEASTGVRYRAVGPDTTGSGGYGDKNNFIQNSRFSMSYVTGTHNIKVGLQMRNGVKKFGEEGAAIDYQFRNQRPTQVTIYAYPLLFHESMRALMGLYAQDQWTMKRLTLNGGVRFDYENAYLPAQHLDAGPYIGVRDFADVTCVPCWKDFSPRISAAYDLFGTGKTAVKVSVGRYTTEERLDTAHANNPLLLSNSSSTRAWSDTNGDFIPQESELGPLGNANFGKTVINTRYSDDVLLRNRPANWSSSVSFQHELRPGTAAGIAYFRTAWQKFTVTDSLSVTPADYTPYCVTLPADPRSDGHLRRHRPDGQLAAAARRIRAGRDEYGPTVHRQLLRQWPSRSDSVGGRDDVAKKRCLLRGNAAVLPPAAEGLRFVPPALGFASERCRSEPARHSDHGELRGDQRRRAADARPRALGKPDDRDADERDSAADPVRRAAAAGRSPVHPELQGVARAPAGDVRRVQRFQQRRGPELEHPVRHVLAAADIDTGRAPDQVRRSDEFLRRDTG
ncbi:MAG: hypothetical protein DMF96_16775 [Acidobacteria bacterium]|nr:MAG: hypothetical protein DMF96_16775 [Acidobacteriota bacterium]